MKYQIWAQSTPTSEFRLVMESDGEFCKESVIESLSNEFTIQSWKRVYNSPIHSVLLWDHCHIK